MASRLRSRNRFGGLTQYQSLRNAAIAAARANNASLWFAGAPSDLAGFVWQDSAGTVPATGTDPIGQLTDRAGSNAATQATAANKPTLEPQANGYFGMRFDPTNDSLSSSAASGYASGLTFIVGFQHTNLGTNRILINPDTNGPQFWLNTSNQIILAANGIGNRVIGPALSSGAVVVSTSLTAGTGTIWRNSSQVATASSIPNFSTTSIIYLGSGAGVFPMNNVANLFCTCPIAMSDADRIAIESFAKLLGGIA